MPSVHPSLQDAIRSNRIDNTYLFYSEEPSSIHEGAKEFAQRLCCHDTPETCNTCPSCKKIESHTQVDLLEIKEDKSIKIDHVKDIQEQIKYGPSIEKYKVVIIYNCDIMTPEAANAFLKTLEDPPSNVVFILTTYHIKKIIPTIKSRSQCLYFPKHTITEPLENRIDLKTLQNMPLFEKLLYANDLSQSSKPDVTHHIYRWIEDAIKEYPTHTALHQRLVSKIRTLSYNVNLKLQIEELLITL